MNNLEVISISALFGDGAEVLFYYETDVLHILVYYYSFTKEREK